ncbi:uncharacterized protein LOC111683754 [Lucilia cuprina]|uniref:uncharacterized protein LOC111683754 n=1 Tax=Lucilia cuprina TaxID=7375 RepID=UPI001F05DFD3|nr:uncharacterized protein LOC111683754 [Lucilia cuprina]
MKCAVGKCKQSNSIKTTVSFYNFPKDVTQRDSWIKFCNRVRPINVQKEKICALHFKKEDFERNLKFELGYSQRRTPKLKPGAVPTIEPCDTTTKIPNINVNVIPNGNVNTIPIKTEACEDIAIKTEIELGDEEITPMTTTIKEDNLQEYIKTLEMNIDVLCKENDELKILQNKSTIIIKKINSSSSKLKLCKCKSGKFTKTYVYKRSNKKT